MEKRKVESSLQKKGFELDVRGDHRFLHHCIGGKKTGISTKTSHGSNKYRDLGPDIQKAIKQQLRLDNLNQLKQLVDCTLSGDDYNQILKEKNLLAGPAGIRR